VVFAGGYDGKWQLAGNRDGKAFNREARKGFAKFAKKSDSLPRVKGTKENHDRDAQKAPRKWKSPQNLKALRQLRKSAKIAEAVAGLNGRSAPDHPLRSSEILAKRASIKPEGDFDADLHSDGVAIFGGGDESLRPSLAWMRFKEYRRAQGVLQRAYLLC
jgi:hypothetical protein